MKQYQPSQVSFAILRTYETTHTSFRNSPTISIRSAIYLIVTNPLYGYLTLARFRYRTKSYVSFFAGKLLSSCFVACLCFIFAYKLSIMLPLRNAALVSRRLDTNRTALRNGTGVGERHNITFSNAGRLGNEIFAFASILAIASHNNLNPVLSASSRLRNVFQITTQIRNKSGGQWRQFYEKEPCALDRRTINMHADMNVEVVGYLQSWKYFRNYEDMVRRQLRFVDEIRLAADSYIRSVVQRNFGPNASGVVSIGIHVRRGDMASNAAYSSGYTVAGVGYLKSAIFYFTRKYKNVVFIVCTDDVGWCEKNVAPLDPRVVIPRRFKSAGVDLAILSRCQHTIMTTGTFGWWGAWLAGGTTIYYKRFPRPGSRIASVFNRYDYFPPQWIPLY